MANLSGSVYGSRSITVNTLAELQTIRGFPNQKAYILYGSSSSDRGRGEFVWFDASTATADGVLIVATTGITTGRWIRSIPDNIYRAIWWGIIPGSNQSTLINGAIAAIPAGAVLLFEQGQTYNITTQITLNKAFTFDGNNSLFSYTGSAAKVFAISVSNVTIQNTKISGTYATYNSSSSLIGTVGPTNASPISNVTIKGCELYNSASDGIELRYVNGIDITDNYIHDHPYSGVSCYSVVGGKIDRNRIETITALGTPGSPNSYGFTNAYGITVQQLSTDTVTSNLKIINNRLKDVRWEGIDTHGAHDLYIAGNTLLNGDVGIAIVSASARAADAIKVFGNHVESLSRGLSSGISISGVSSFRAQAMVAYNSVKGQYIRLEQTRGCVVHGNTVDSPEGNYGIYFSGENYNTAVTDNKFIDVWSLAAGNTYAIFFDNNNNNANISGNSLIDTGATLTNKNKYGFSTAAGSTGCNAFIGTNDFSAAVTEQYRATGQFASRFMTEDGATVARITTSSVYVVAQTDKTVIYDYSTGGTTITLPAITFLNDKRQLIINNVSAGTLTTSIAMYTGAATSSTTIAAGTRAVLTYDLAANKIWRT